MAQISAICFLAPLPPCHFFYFSATATCATFLVRAGGAVALKVAQVPSTAKHYLTHYYYSRSRKYSLTTFEAKLFLKQNFLSETLF